MPVLTIAYQDEAERLGLEQAIAYQMRQTAQTAQDGTVLAACEQVALNEGRTFLRNSLAAAVQSRIDEAEQKGGAPGAAGVICQPAAHFSDCALFRLAFPRRCRGLGCLVRQCRRGIWRSDTAP